MQTEMFNHLPQFQVVNKPSEEYGEWTNKVSQLIKRPFFQVHKMFEREGWTEEEIKRSYLIATKHNGNCDSAVCWWANRKRRNAL